jgi:hypothetical protein
LEVTSYENTPLDRENPNSIISRIGKAQKFEEALAKAMESEEFEQLRTEKDFKEAFGNDKNFKIMKHLRFSFWNEYNKSVDSQKKMSLERVYSGVCYPKEFHKFIKEDLYLTFIVTVPASIELVQQELIQLGYEKMEEVLEQEIQNPDGTLNTNLIKEQVKILENLENRRWGGVVHRAQIHNKTDLTTSHEGTTEGSNEKLRLEEKVAALKLELAGEKKQSSSAIEVDYKEVDSDEKHGS